MITQGKWIWAKGSSENGTGDCTFRYVFPCEKRPRTAMLSVAATNRCSVTVNGNFVLYAAGRAATDTETFYDTADIAGEIKKGANVLVLRVKGGAARNGVVAECPELNVASSDRFLSYESHAMTDENGVYLYNSTTEHRLEGIDAPEFISDLFGSSEIVGDAEAVLPRPVPGVRFGEAKKRPFKKTETGIVMETEPGAVYPTFTVTANSGEHITITGSLSSRKLEYVTCAGEQTFEFDEPLYGTLTFAIPASVKLGSAGYRLVEMGATETGKFKCDVTEINEMYRQARNTFRACCVNAFTDYAGGDEVSVLDASVMARNALYTLKEGAAYAETALVGMLDALEGNPSWVNATNRAHTLLALSDIGLAADCFKAINNADLKQRYLGAAVRMLQTLELDTLGTLLRGEIDTRYNEDTELTGKSLYFSVLRLCRSVADELGIERYNEFLNDANGKLSKTADSILRGNGLSLDKNFHDDRANAFAVLSGIAPQFMSGDAARVMSSVYGSSPMLEGYVTEALMLARSDWALLRIKAREAIVRGEYLPEDYAGEGTAARAASAAYVSVFFKSVAGVELGDGGRRVTLTPDLNVVSNVEFTVPVGDGKLYGRFGKTKNGGSEFFVDNQTEADVVLRLKVNKGITTDEPVKTLELKKGKNSFRF